MPICKKCNMKFPNHIKINGISKNLCNRKYCLECSPYGLHNTRKITELTISENKVCSKCKTKKSLSEFYKRRANKASAYCKICSDKYSTKRWINIKLKGMQYKNNKCFCCNGEYHYSAMQFHHVNPKEKEYNWNKLRLMSWEKIKIELDKCILVCANCHAMITAKALSILVPIEGFELTFSVPITDNRLEDNSNYTDI